MRAARALIASTVLVAACSGDGFLGPAAPLDNAALFDQVWTSFDRHYSFFELKGVDWQQVGDRYRPRAIAATDEHALANVFTQMFAELKDVHVALTPAGEGSTVRYLSRFDTTTAGVTSLHATANGGDSWSMTSGRHIRYGFAAPSVGYVAIASFHGMGWDGEMDEALHALEGATALIVDVRNNGGGSVQLAVRIAGRFVDRTATYGYVRIRNGPAHDDFTEYNAESVKPAGAKRFDGRVYVLTDRRTASSAEDFVLAMRTLDRATIVGDTTAGASGGPVVRELSNGWTYQLSEWIEYTPDRLSFEDIGLAPHVAVARNAARDAAFDAALVLAAKR